MIRRASIQDMAGTQSAPMYAKSRFLVYETAFFLSDPIGLFSNHFFSDLQSLASVY